EIQVPSEQRGENDGRGVDRDSASDATLDEKQETAEEPRLLVEALAEIFVSGVNLEPLIDWDENRADHDERERLPEIILDEPDAAFVSLPRHREERDRPGLGREDREADGAPANRFV